MTKHIQEMRHIFQASGLQLCPARPSSRPQSLQSCVSSGLQLHPEVDLLHLQVPNTPRLAGAAGRLHGRCADQNKPMDTVTAMMHLFWSAHPLVQNGRRRPFKYDAEKITKNDVQ